MFQKKFDEICNKFIRDDVNQNYCIFVELYAGQMTLKVLPKASLQAKQMPSPMKQIVFQYLPSMNVES